MEVTTASELVSELITAACVQRASDIHIDPADTNICIRFRIDGRMRDQHVLPRAIHAELIARLKILAGLRTDEHARPQDGRFRFDSMDIRISILPAYHGENAILRLLAPRGEEQTLMRLGMSATEVASVRRVLGSTTGMILVTGPTGSGKTTTLYALIQELAAQEYSLVTIEDPIEYSVPNITQVQTHPEAGLTFAQGLRSILRQDPDVIMVGEMRDEETVGLAINAALTGHLVLSTLHTTSAVGTLPRLVDMGAEPYLIASTMRLLISQRLVRRVCESCASPQTVSEAMRSELLRQFPDCTIPDQQSVGSGCDECMDTGYRGRIALFEILPVTEAVREAILNRSPLSELQRIATDSGMRTLMEHGLDCVANGLTTLYEVLRIHYD